MKTALVYDRVNKWGGAERVLLALHELFPQAPLYTSVFSPENAGWAKVFPKIYTSFLQKFPPLRNKHELLATFMPLSFESFDFSGYDLVISVTSEAAKGIVTKPGTRHICYCLTPTRYLYSGEDFYSQHPPLILGSLPFYLQISQPFLRYVKHWDKIASCRPDRIIAISNEVSSRIKRFYDLDSEVVHPPVDIDKFKFSKNIKGEMAKKLIGASDRENGFYLIVSRLVPYKRVDLAIEAFNDLNKTLIVVGTGSEENRLKYMAKENVIFVKDLTDVDLAMYYQEARAFIQPQDEDFGIAAVEAQSAGTAVIAYKAGGALDTVVEGQTGLFFSKQDSKSLIQAVKRFERMKFDPRILRKNAIKFSKEKFKARLLKIIENV